MEIYRNLWKLKKRAQLQSFGVGLFGAFCFGMDILLSSQAFSFVIPDNPPNFCEHGEQKLGGAIRDPGKKSKAVVFSADGERALLYDLLLPRPL
jgi:hypothetical protein